MRTETKSNIHDLQRNGAAAGDICPDLVVMTRHYVIMIKISQQIHCRDMIVHNMIVHKIVQCLSI